MKKFSISTLAIFFSIFFISSQISFADDHEVKEDLKNPLIIGTIGFQRVVQFCSTRKCMKAAQLAWDTVQTLEKLTDPERRKRMDDINRQAKLNTELRHYKRQLDRLDIPAEKKQSAWERNSKIIIERHEYAEAVRQHEKKVRAENKARRIAKRKLRYKKWADERCMKFKKCRDRKRAAEGMKTGMMGMRRGMKGGRGIGTPRSTPKGMKGGRGIGTPRSTPKGMKGGRGIGTPSSKNTPLDWNSHQKNQVQNRNYKPSVDRSNQVQNRNYKPSVDRSNQVQNRNYKPSTSKGMKGGRGIGTPTSQPNSF